MVRPLKKPPDRHAGQPHGDITLSIWQHLFNEITTAEEELMDTIRNVRE